MKQVLKIMKAFFKTISYVLEFILALAMLYLIFVVICGLIPVAGDQPKEGVGIYVRSNGVHTDICLPVETKYFDWKTFIPTEHYQQNTKFKFISFGWGDKEFYINTPEWSDLNIGVALNATLLPSSTAMHVTYFDYEPAVNERSKHVLIKDSKYQDLMEYIQSSFKLKNDKPVLIPNLGYGKYDNFYDGTGSFHLFRTCNAWTNRGLKIAGVRTALLALTEDGIMRHLP